METTSYLRSPILFLLANRSQLLILRELFIQFPTFRTAGELEQAVQLSKQGVFNAINNLENLGILIKKGRKGSFYYGIREKHPFFSLLKELFIIDMQFHGSLISELREIVAHEPITSAYLSGNYATGNDQYSDMLELNLISDQPYLNKIKKSLENTIEDSGIQLKYDISIYIRVFSIEEFNRLDIQSALFWGVEIKTKNLTKNEIYSHDDLDQKSLNQMDEFILKIEQSPELIEKTIQVIEKKMGDFTPPVQKTYAIWLDILKNWPISRLKKFFKSETDLRTQLIQSNPFWL